MSYLVSVTAWNSANLNFNLPFANGATTTSTPASALTSFGDLTIEGEVYAFATQTRTITTQVDSDWVVGNNSAVLGTNLVTDVNGMLLTGGLNGIGLTLADQFEYGLSGFNIGASRMGAAQATASNSDDVALFNAIMRGNDLVFLSQLDDLIVTGAGKDLVYGALGNDTISGGNGNDLLLGENGLDRLTGGAGNDGLFGGADRDVLVGNDGFDTLVGGAGNDILNGGGNRDFFVFSSTSGNDTVQDFTSTDRVVIIDPAITLGDLTITQVGANTTMSFGSNTITFQNASFALFNASRIILNGQATVDAGVDAFMTGWDYFA